MLQPGTQNDFLRASARGSCTSETVRRAITSSLSGGHYGHVALLGQEFPSVASQLCSSLSLSAGRVAIEVQGEGPARAKYGNEEDQPFPSPNRCSLIKLDGARETVRRGISTRRRAPAQGTLVAALGMSPFLFSLQIRPRFWGPTESQTHPSYCCNCPCAIPLFQLLRVQCE